MKITEYGKVSTLNKNNIFILDGPDGTKSIMAPDLAKALLSILPPDKLMDTIKSELAPEMHRNIFRGKRLGYSVTAAQKAAIKNNSFDDLYVGDYWTISDINWRIVDINYWYNCGNSAFTTPHLVIMPDTNIHSAKMNNSDTTTGGYVGSLMRTTILTKTKPIVANAFGSMVLTHRDFLSNAVSNGYSSAGAWYDSTVDLPNEIMMYGNFIFAAAGNGSLVPTRHTTNKTQLALFSLVPKFIHNRQLFWLRDVVSSASFATVGNDGAASYLSASNYIGVRPVFAVG